MAYYEMIKKALTKWKEIFMKNYYEEILESLGKQVSELLDKLEKETDWVKKVYEWVRCIG